MAGLAREHAEAVRSAGRTRARRSSRCSRASPTPSCSRARSSSPTPISASSWPSNCASAASRPTSCSSRCAAIPVRRSRLPPCSPPSAIRDALVLVLAADHVVRKPEEFREACRHAAAAAAEGTDRDLRHRAHPSGDQLRLHPSRREAQRRIGARGRSVRGEAGCRDRRALRGRRLSLEQRQFPVSRRRHAATRSSASSRPWPRPPRRRSHGLTPRPRFPAACGRAVRARAEEIDRLCRDGAHQARRRGARRYRLVGRRQLERGLGHARSRCSRQRDRRPRGHARQPQQPRALGGVRAHHRGRARRRHRRRRPPTPCWSARARKAEQVKTLVEQLKAQNHRAAVEHRRIYRPWGYYQDVDIAPALSGEAHRGEAGQQALTAEALPSLRALGRGQGNRRGHGRQRRAQRPRERDRSISRSAAFIGSPIPARSRSS